MHDVLSNIFDDKPSESETIAYASSTDSSSASQSHDYGFQRTSCSLDQNVLQQIADRLNMYKSSDENCSIDGPFDGIVTEMIEVTSESTVSSEDNKFSSHFDRWFDDDTCLMTPPKKSCSDVMPWTPTANLKLLLKAASPDLRSREMVLGKKKIKPKKKLGTKPAFQEPTLSLSDNVEGAAGSNGMTEHCGRKEKSLGLLCQRFLDKFPLCPLEEQEMEVKLDEVAQHIGVGRRRIYDIINVMEALEFASRLAKNKYIWHGKRHLLDTIARLFKKAKLDGLQQQIIHAKQLEDISQEQLTCKSDEGLLDVAKKSLTFLSQKFFMLFLVAPENTLNLDVTARVLLGDVTSDQHDVGKFKTTIRRLYDIANILSSLNLIQKLSAAEMRCKKPVFVYIGPKVNDMLRDTKSAATVTKRHALMKHSSFDQICEIAEIERKKLCLFERDVVAEAGSKSGTESLLRSGRETKTNVNNTMTAPATATSSAKRAVLTIRRRHPNTFCRTKSDGAIRNTLPNLEHMPDVKVPTIVNLSPLPVFDYRLLKKQNFGELSTAAVHPPTADGTRLCILNNENDECHVKVFAKEVSDDEMHSSAAVKDVRDGSGSPKYSTALVPSTVVPSLSSGCKVDGLGLRASNSVSPSSVTLTSSDSVPNDGLGATPLLPAKTEHRIPLSVVSPVEMNRENGTFRRPVVVLRTKAKLSPNPVLINH